MMKLLMSVFVLAATATVTPVEAAPAAIASAAIRPGAEQSQPLTGRSQTTRQVRSTPLPVLQTPSLTQTVGLTETVNLTATVNLTPTTVLTPTSVITPSIGLTPTIELTATDSLTPTIDEGEAAGEEGELVDDVALDEVYREVLMGTIIANRTDVPIRFFVEGRTVEVAPLRSIGLDLMRDTAVLNLFNCEASKDDADVGCFWDPYLLTRDGFYEVVVGQAIGQDILLALRTAGAPPANQIWIQNRTGERETVIVNNELYEVAPASVREFSVLADAPVIVQLRNCISSNDRTICEWAPQGAEAGFYYGLVRTETPGPNDAQLISLTLQGIIASSGETVKAPPQAVCRLRVPTLNVRSGPGLEFPIIAKIRGTETEPGSVVVVAFDATETWMQVTERVARDGWVTSNPEFILCEGALADLPVIGQPVAIAAPEPTEEPVIVQPTEEVELAPAATEEPPVVAEPAPVDGGESVEPAPGEAPAADAPAEEATPTPSVPDVPEGLARIVVNNGFDQTIRFTLDQRYRPERDNLSGEWDLEPGASTTILVYPGTIAFSASSAWRAISGNAELLINEQEDRALWITFVLDPVEEDQWNLVHY